jgi:hypothetical protein
MGQMVRTSLRMLEKYPVRNRLRSKPVTSMTTQSEYLEHIGLVTDIKGRPS